MSFIGIGFGSHIATIAVYNAESDTTEVLTDDVGLRFIPCVVAFRGENEVIIGNAALQQQLKNAPNTFVDIRAMLLDDTASGDRLVHVPALGKDISTAEIVSHFFRNILNQIKQQSVSKLKPIKDCVISLPFAIGDAAKTRFIECAKLGGVRVREFCLDDTSILMSYGLDLPAADKQESKKQVVLVADIGWSQSSIGLYEVNDGLFFLICRRTGTEFNVRLAVEKLVDFCVKDFERKNKMRCSDNKRSIMRLTLECENGVRILSNCQEAMIVVDSLFEGVDYSGKISRSRFDDLCGSGISMLRSIVNSTLEAGHIEASDIKQILFAGGGGGMPIVQTAMKSLFPAAQFPRMQSNISEAACIGAALQGRCYHSSELSAVSLLDNVELQALSCGIFLSNCALPENIFNSDDIFNIFPTGTLIPCSSSVSIAIAENCIMYVLAGVGEQKFLLSQFGFPAQDLATISLTFTIDSSSVLSISCASTHDQNSKHICSIVLS